MKYDILSFHKKMAGLKVEGNSVSSLKKTDIQKHALRRFENGKLYQTSRVGQATEERLLADSREWGGDGTPHEYGFAPAWQEKRTGKILPQTLIQEFETLATEYMARHPEFVFSGACNLSETVTTLKSNQGLDLQSSGSLCDWYLLYQRRASGNMVDGSLGQTTSLPMFREELVAHEEFLKAHKKEAKLQAGRYPVLFSYPETPLGKLVESFAINRYREGNCVFAGKLGQTLFSPQVSLVDQAYDPEIGNWQFFDGEGVVRSQDPLKLVDQGRFVSLISDLRFGHKYNAPSTGNGLRSYNTGVSVGLHSLRFAKGQQPWRQVLKSLDRCLVVTIAAGGDSNGLGEFSSPVQAAYLFEKGEIVGRLPQFTVKALLADYLGKNLIAVSSDGFTPGASYPCVIAEMDVQVN